MELVYSNEKVKKQCESIKAAKQLFGGDEMLCQKLLARINAFKQAETIKDIVVQPMYHFHKLKHKKGRDLEDFFAIDVKSRKEQWRVIIQLLDSNRKPYTPCDIDKLAGIVQIVKIMEVSKHYE